MLRPLYPIETARLSLRPFEPGDLDDLCAFDSRPEVARYLTWEARDRTASRRYLERKIRQASLESEGDGLVLAFIWREIGRVVGDVALRWVSREHREGEIGFVINPDFHGRGLATEAAEVILRLGFDDLGLHRIMGRCDARNLHSARLMERLGMRREGHLVETEFIKGEWTDELVYAMLEHEWSARRSIVS